MLDPARKARRAPRSDPELFLTDSAGQDSRDDNVHLLCVAMGVRIDVKSRGHVDGKRDELAVSLRRRDDGAKRRARDVFAVAPCDLVDVQRRLFHWCRSLVVITSRLSDMAIVKAKPRSEKAAETRRRMLDAAYELFAERGFRGTTMDTIAERAGVAVQTLYFTFHTKDDLLQAVQDRAVLGDGEPVPPPMQPWFAAMVAANRIAESVRHFAKGIDAIAARVAPLIPTMHEVAGDPAGAVWRESERLRRDGFVSIIATWTTKAPLRPGLDEPKAVDLLLVLAGPEIYRQLVVDSGWTHDEHVYWVECIVLREIFGRRVQPDRLSPRLP
ncbi:MAG: helix-turn-helix domain-containing protein [Ilumatobacteraceae bacterium]